MNNEIADALVLSQARPSIVHHVSDSVENAIVLWAEATTRTETRDRHERLRDKQQIIRSFLQFVSKHPGEVEPMDVRAWHKYLESEKSENTVYSYLSRVSSFYEWLRRYPGIKDHIPGNPVSLGRPKVPRPHQTEKTKAWTDDEMNAILDAIAAEVEKGSIHAMRDYAVTLFNLFSGLRRNELFGLRGNDIELLEEGLIVRYKQKGGKYQRREVAHRDVREALLAYLKKSKRLSVLPHRRSHLDPARSRRRARTAAHLTILRQQLEAVRGKGRDPSRQYSSNAPHLCADHL